MDDNFEGHKGRECGDHRTTGGRAWCFDDSEWCYPEMPCRGCEVPLLRAEIERLREWCKRLATGHVSPSTSFQGRSDTKMLAEKILEALS